MPAWDNDLHLQPNVVVEPSAPAELFWYLIALAKGRAFPTIAGLTDDQAFADQVRTFWNDRSSYAFSELLVLAHRGGCLLGTDLDQFFDHLDHLASQPGGNLALRTEQPDEAEAIRARLNRLRRDAELRQRYATVLHAAWARVEPTWRSVGRRAVEQRARETRERLERGTPLLELLSETHIVRRHRRAELTALLNAELAHGSVALSPVYFTAIGAHILDLPGLLHLSMPVDDPDPRQELAHVAEHVARKAKVLSDATRVALLADLVRRPASITELAKRFELSQPTISMHVKLLREADLLSAVKHGSRTVYSVDRDRLLCLFDDLETALIPREAP